MVRERADGAGTDLVSEDENGPCAVGVGMSSSLAELARRTGRSLPLLMVLTLLPFKARRGARAAAASRAAPIGLGAVRFLFYWPPPLRAG